MSAAGVQLTASPFSGAQVPYDSALGFPLSEPSKSKVPARNALTERAGGGPS